MFGGVGVSQQTPQYHFIMYIKYIKKKHARNALTLNTLRGAVSSRNTRNVVKKYPKCRQEIPEILGPQRVANVVKKSVKCRQEIRKMSPRNP